MPELPEVETVRNVLKTKILNQNIQEIQIYWDKIVKTDIEKFKTQLINQTIIDIKRIGKYLLFELNDYILVSHLRMEGKYFVTKELNKTKHDHIIFKLSNNYLIYNDTRKFGTMHLYLKTDKLTCLENCGIDALEIDLATFIQNSRKKKTTLKQLLLDQKVLAGVGNIYADEIIFATKLFPTMKIETLSDQNFADILKATKQILNQAIQQGGTTIRSYTSSLEVSGSFQLALNVHTQKQCRVCGNDITKIKVAQRGTYVCLKCQKP